jgi:hypothetical protein
MELDLVHSGRPASMELTTWANWDGRMGAENAPRCREPRTSGLGIGRPPESGRRRAPAEKIGGQRRGSVGEEEGDRGVICEMRLLTENV